jgi:hypothetical protein
VDPLVALAQHEGGFGPINGDARRCRKVSRRTKLARRFTLADNIANALGQHNG